MSQSSSAFFKLFCIFALVSQVFYSTASATLLDEPETKTIGSYTAGCIKGTQSLAMNGIGYQIMRPSRQRFFGHPELIHFIEHLGQTVDAKALGTLLIGDLAMAKGGPMPFGHRSHQTGLDVDIWFWLNSPANQSLLTDEQRESLQAPSFVFEKVKAIDLERWQPENTAVLKIAAQHPLVERIFVNPAIKLHLCQTIPQSEHHWLHKVRPWWHHADHFHVRLKCPPGQAQCKSQAPVESGPGCDASLNEWFIETEPKIKKKPAPVPLPEECVAYLRE